MGRLFSHVYLLLAFASRDIKEPAADVDRNMGLNHLAIERCRFGAHFRNDVGETTDRTRDSANGVRLIHFFHCDSRQIALHGVGQAGFVAEVQV